MYYVAQQSASLDNHTLITQAYAMTQTINNLASDSRAIADFNAVSAKLMKQLQAVHS